MPVFAADELAAELARRDQPADAVAPGDRRGGSPTSSRWHAPTSAPPDRRGRRLTRLARAPERDVAAAPAPTPPQQSLLPIVPAATAVRSPTATALDDDDAESRGWGVRRSGEARSQRRRGGPVIAVPRSRTTPSRTTPGSSDIRRRIEDRLRRKRCDEAAALLQELAQETGGRAVAELAMNAGDRCRALGKSNAALNCYLAAARSDPVYELPLSRLADICIDDQDTELAVSYLERIARIYRFRGDDKAALRVVPAHRHHRAVPRGHSRRC